MLDVNNNSSLHLTSNFSTSCYFLVNKRLGDQVTLPLIIKQRMTSPQFLGPKTSYNKKFLHLCKMRSLSWSNAFRCLATKSPKMPKKSARMLDFNNNSSLHLTSNFSTSCYFLGNGVDNQNYFNRINDEIFGPVVGQKSNSTAFKKKTDSSPISTSLSLSKTKKKTVKKEQYPFENELKKNFLKSQSDIDDIDDYLSFPRKFSLKLPSVSKIIQATMPPEQRAILDRWEANKIAELGEEAFQEIKKELFRHGHELHYSVEEYFRDPGSEFRVSLKADGDPTVENLIHSLSPVIDDFQRPALSLESQVIHPTLNYAGYFDALAYHKKSKKVVLIDWKTSEKKKSTLAKTFDAPLQVAAYVGALNHDSRYPFQIENALVVVVNKSGSVAEVLPMTKRQLKNYWVKWVERCEKYAQIIMK